MPKHFHTQQPGSVSIRHIHQLAQVSHTSTTLKICFSFQTEKKKNEVRVLKASSPLCMRHSRQHSSGQLLSSAAMTQHSNATAVYASRTAVNRQTNFPCTERTELGSSKLSYPLRKQRLVKASTNQNFLSI